MVPSIKNRNGAKERSSDKWYTQLMIKTAWSLIPVSVTMTVWVMAQLHAVEKRAEAHSDDNDKAIIQMVTDNQKQLIHTIEKLENKIDKNQNMIVDEIKNDRNRRNR